MKATLATDHAQLAEHAARLLQTSLELEHDLPRFVTWLDALVPLRQLALSYFDPRLGCIKAVAVSDRSTFARRDTWIVPSAEQRRRLGQLSCGQVYEWQCDAGPDSLPGRLTAVVTAEPRLAVLWAVSFSAGRVVLMLVLREPAQASVSLEEGRLLASVARPVGYVVGMNARLQELEQVRELLEEDKRELQSQLRTRVSESVIGADGGLRETMELIRDVAQQDCPVLLLGETGTGKEVVANALHSISRRRGGPFVKVNCGAIPETLLDSQLFGHERGAFTGSLSLHRGHFERADGGTIFLDEVGELTPNAQVRLLRVLQEQTIERVGGSQAIQLDLRVVAATNRPLEQMVRSGHFREDLYYRLSVFPVRLPPLRARLGDIPALVQHFIAGKSHGMKRHPTPGLGVEALQQLIRYSWPGNVRELENAVERALILCRDGTLSFPFLRSEPTIGDQARDASSRARTLEAVVVAHITQVLAETGGRIEGGGGAAEILGLHPSTLRTRMRKLEIPFGRGARRSTH